MQQRISDKVRARAEMENEKPENKLSPKCIQWVSLAAFKALDRIKRDSILAMCRDNSMTCEAVTDRLASDARVSLPKPSLFAFVTFLSRLVIYAKAQKDAAASGGDSVIVPRTKNDYDATLLAIWRKYKKWIKEGSEASTVAFPRFYIALSTLMYKLGSEFGIEVEEEEKAPRAERRPSKTPRTRRQRTPPDSPASSLSSFLSSVSEQED